VSKNVTNVVRKLFNYNKWESVKSVLFNLGCLNVTHLIMIWKINFYRHLLTSKSCTLYNVFMSFCHVATMICVSQFLADLGHAHFQGNYLCARSALPIQSDTPNLKSLAQVVFEILRSKRIGVTSLTFQGHVTSSVT